MRRYKLERDSWGQLLALTHATWPARYEWPQLLAGVRRLSRWIERPELDELSAYLLASEARSLMDEVRGDFAIAGLTPNGGPPSGAAYWEYVATNVAQLVATVNADFVSRA